MNDRNGSALVAALLALVVGGAVAAALAEVARLTVVRGRLQEHATRAWFLAEAGLAETLAAMAPGRSFDADLAAPPRSGDLGDPGRWTWISRLADDTNDGTPDSNERVILRVEATGPAPIRRRLEAVVGREPEPFLPGAATLAGGVRELARDFLLDGRDSDMATRCSTAADGPARAGLALAAGASLPAIDPARVVGRDGLASIWRATIPDLTPLADDLMGTPYPAGILTGPLGRPAAPRFTLVHGDAIATSAVTGAGLLYVDGHLSIRRALDFTGVVAAAEGIDVSAGGTLTVCGAVWAGGEPALAVRGTGAVRRSVEAILLAHRLAPLPARAEVVATRELYGGTSG